MQWSPGIIEFGRERVYVYEAWRSAVGPDGQREFGDSGQHIILIFQDDPERMMGQQTMFLIIATLVLGAFLVLNLTRSSTEMSRNSADTFTQAQADRIDASALEIAMRTLADSTKWRTTIPNLALFGGRTTVTFKDTIVGTDTAVVIRSASYYASLKDTSRAASRVIVKARSAGYLPPIVRGAFTADGPLDWEISNMYIDGRDYQADGATINPLKGIYAVSTGQPSFTNIGGASIGGTSYNPSPTVDLVPACPQDPRTIELSAPWPSGWPTNPDAALSIAVGTLKSIAQKKSIPGSQYVTDPSKLVKPLRGVTFVEVPAGQGGKAVDFGSYPSGIFVYHSAATDGLAQGLTTKAGPFAGLMICDKAFHIHMDILGAIVLLSPNTIINQNCAGNNGHWVRYSSATVKAATTGIRNASGGGGASGKGGWRNLIQVVSWYH